MEQFSIQKSVTFRKIYSPIQDLNFQWSKFVQLFREVQCSSSLIDNDETNGQLKEEYGMPIQMSIYHLQHHKLIRELMKNCLYRNLCLIRNHQKMLKSYQLPAAHSQIVLNRDPEAIFYKNLLREKMTELSQVKITLKRKSTNSFVKNLTEKLKDKTLQSKSNQTFLVSNRMKQEDQLKFIEQGKVGGTTFQENSVDQFHARHQNRRNICVISIDQQRKVRQSIRIEGDKYDFEQEKQDKHSSNLIQIDNQITGLGSFKPDQPYLSLMAKRKFDFMPKRPFRLNRRSRKDISREFDQCLRRQILDPLLPKRKNSDQGFFNIEKMIPGQVANQISLKNYSLSLLNSVVKSPNQKKLKKDIKKTTKIDEKKAHRRILEKKNLSQHREVNEEIIIIKSLSGNFKGIQNIPGSHNLPNFRERNTQSHSNFNILDPSIAKFNRRIRKTDFLRGHSSSAFRSQEKKISENFSNQNTFFEKLKIS